MNSLIVAYVKTHGRKGVISLLQRQYENLEDEAKVLQIWMFIETIILVISLVIIYICYFHSYFAANIYLHDIGLTVTYGIAFFLFIDLILKSMKLNKIKSILYVIRITIRTIKTSHDIDEITDVLNRFINQLAKITNYSKIVLINLLISSGRTVV